MTLPPGSPPTQLPGCTPLALWALPALAPEPICRPYAQDSVLLPLQGQHGSSAKQPAPEQSGHWHLPSPREARGERAGGGMAPKGAVVAWQLPGQARWLMFLVLSVAIVPAGPESWLNGASVPSQAGCPGWLGGIPPGSWEARSDTSCPHCTCWDGGGRGTLRQAPICVP